MPAPVGRGMGSFGRADSSGARGVKGYDDRHRPLSRDSEFPYDRDEKMYGQPDTYDRGSARPSRGDRPPVPKGIAADDHRWDDEIEESTVQEPKLKIGDRVRSKDGSFSGTVKKMSPYGLYKVALDPSKWAAGSTEDFFIDELEMDEAMGVPGLMIGKSADGGGGSNGGRTTPGTSGCWSTGWNDETPDDDEIETAGKGKKMKSESAWSILEAFVSLVDVPHDSMQDDGQNIDGVEMDTKKGEFRSAFDRSMELVTKLPQGEVLRLIVDLDPAYAASEFLDGMDDDELFDIYRSWGDEVAPSDTP